MSLLEALLATVILSVVAIGCLEGTRGAARLQRRAEEISATTIRAESAMSRAVLGLPVGDGVSMQRVPYGAGDRLDMVQITVTGTAGERVQLSRLVERATLRAR